MTFVFFEVVFRTEISDVPTAFCLTQDRRILYTKRNFFLDYDLSGNLNRRIPTTKELRGPTILDLNKVT